MGLTAESFILDTPLYTKVIITVDNKDLLRSLSRYNLTFDGFNPIKKCQTTFAIVRSATHGDNNFYANGGIATIQVDCKRYHDSFLFFILWSPDDKILMKIGQYPSVADFHIGEIKEYKTLLSSEKLKEFTRAIGLAANGVGIGSFVYLRRIFEYLISEAFSQSIKDNVIAEADFQRSRMDEKISILKSYLPSFLYENKSIYSILSLGIHELDEDTCLAHFDTLKVGIEIILDEKLDELRKKEKIEAAKKKIDVVNSSIKQ